jgi:hypothetical protein
MVASGNVVSGSILVAGSGTMSSGSVLRALQKEALSLNADLSPDEGTGIAPVPAPVIKTEPADGKRGRLIERAPQLGHEAQLSWLPLAT